MAGCRHSRDISGGLDIHGQGIHGSSSKEQPLHVSNVHYDRHRLCRHCTINSRMYRSFEGESNTIREAILGHYPFVRIFFLEIMIGDAHKSSICNGLVKTISAILNLTFQVGPFLMLLWIKSHPGLT